MNVYEIVTEKIVEQLEQGVVPWKQPWGWPRNFVTRQEYRGINVIQERRIKKWNTGGAWETLAFSQCR